MVALIFPSLHDDYESHSNESRRHGNRHDQQRRGNRTGRRRRRLAARNGGRVTGCDVVTAELTRGHHFDRGVQCGKALGITERGLVQIGGTGERDAARCDRHTDFRQRCKRFNLFDRAVSGVACSSDGGGSAQEK